MRIPHGPIRQLGEHEVALQLHSDVIVQLKLNLVPEA
ncbi:50S ribosomal L9 C-terminal domain-containing protein [Rickettsiella massiliensis]